MSAYHDISREAAAARADAARTERRRARRRRFRPTGVPADGGRAGRDDSLESMRAELVLLREENVGLKLAQERGPDLGSILRSVRVLPDAQADDLGDEATQVLIDAMVLRESLIEVCAAIERAMVEARAKLATLEVRS